MAAGSASAAISASLVFFKFGAFKNCFDDKIARRKSGNFGIPTDTVQQVRSVLLQQTGMGVLSSHLLHLLKRTLGSLVRNVDHNDFVAGPSGGVADSGSHQACSKHPDPLDRTFGLRDPAERLLAALHRGSLRD